MRIEDLLLRNKDNENIAIEYKDDKVSFKEWHNMAINVSRLLESTNKKIGNIAIYMPNSISYAIAYFAILYKKGVVIPIFYGSTIHEIDNTMKFCECNIILTISSEYNKLLSLFEHYTYDISIICIDNGFINSIKGESGEISNSYFFKNNGNVHDVAVMLHTSGTTNNPKKVMLTHNNIISNIIANIKSLRLSNKDISLIVLPMVFGYCNTAQFLSHLYVGAKIVIMDGIFLPQKFFELVERKKVTNTTAVPTMLLMLQDYRYGMNYSIDSLRFICFGGGVISTEQIRIMMNKFPKIDFIQTYGQTECSPRVTALLPNDAIRKIGSVGKPIPGVEIKINDNGMIKFHDKSYIIGEVLVKGSNVMKGYYKNDNATREVKEGEWIHTGDIGYIDEEGYLYLKGRAKNIIISSGINIYPEEIESIIKEIDGVKDVHVKGKEDKKLGEVTIADIVVENENISKEDILMHCRGKISSYKIPHEINFVEKLEVTYNGKIKRGNYCE